MARRPTIADLAEKSGVSVATVDRVLNRRLPVRAETAQRVYDAALAIGYHATGLLRHRLHEERPQRRFAFLLRKPEQHFYQTLGRALADAVAAHPAVRGRAVVDHIDGPSPFAMAERIAALGERADALGVVLPDHPAIGEAVDRLRGRGVPTWSLLSDLTAGGRAGYIGIDNRKAGRTAAWAIARTARRAGEVAILVGSHRFVGHEMREIGFRSYFREHAPDFTVLETLVNLEDSRISYQATIALLDEHPDLVGINVAGGGMEGTLRALQDRGVGRRLAVACNELTPETRAALIDQTLTMVIGTPIRLLATTLVDAMVRTLETSNVEPPTQLFLPHELYISENI
jgi:LacI family transcriptional regulator